MGKFTKDASFTFFSNILQFIIGTVIYVIIARVLGPEKNGIYSLAVLLPAVIITFTQFGMSPALIYHVGKKKYPLKELFGSSIIVSFLTTFFSLLVGLIIIFFFGGKFFPGVPVKYLYLSLLIIPLKNFLELVITNILGAQKIFKYNLVQIAYFLIFLLAMGIFLIFKFGVAFAITAEAFSLFASCAILIFQIKKELGGVVFSFNKNLFKDLFDYGFKIYFGNVAITFVQKIDVWMVNFFMNPLNAGFYAVAALLAGKIQLISQSVGTILFPRISSETEEQTIKLFTPVVCRNVLFLGFLLALFLGVSANILITVLYSQKYHGSIAPFQVLLLGSVAFSGFKILNYDLAGRGKPIVNTYISLIALALSIVLNIILVPKYGIMGAAWASATYYIISFAIQLSIYAKISGNNILDMILIKKSDFGFYKILFLMLKKRLF